MFLIITEIYLLLFRTHVNIIAKIKKIKNFTSRIKFFLRVLFEKLSLKTKKALG